MYNLNYTPTLGVQSWREIIPGVTQTKAVEYHCYRLFIPSGSRTKILYAYLLSSDLLCNLIILIIFGEKYEESVFFH
jgi:hypothetical protein